MSSPSNFLNLPFRRTQAISLSTALHNYITSSYNQHPSLFTSDLSIVDALRTAATAITEPHPSNIQKVQAYCAQLVWLTTKFPLDVGADFVWYPSLGYHATTAHSANNIRFELANVMFNLGVLYCQLGVHANRSTSEGLKAASNYFVFAAGTFKHLREVVVPDMRAAVPEDMDSATLECVEGVMLAQAQECFWATAVKGGYKDTLVAKVAARVAELYTLAEESGKRSDAVSSEWIHHLKAKEGHFGGVAQYRAARDALEKRQYGEEVARLRASLDSANQGLTESRYINKTVLGDLQALKVRVEDDLRRAEKDNDIIYLLPVPTKATMKPIQAAAMVSTKTPREVADPVTVLHEGVALGKPLFVKLVPYAVHLAASVYQSRKDDTVQKIVTELETLTAQIHSTLQSLNLPGSLQALEKPLGLPPGLVSHAEEIRQKRGIDRLQNSMDDITKLKNNDRELYEEGISLLRSEADDDEMAKKKYGTDRWARPGSGEVAQHLYKSMNDIEGYLKAAETTDATVLEKVRKNENLILLLSSTDRDLEDAVPSSRRAAIPPQIEKEVSKLRGALNDLNRLESRRKKKIEVMKQKAQDDDVNPDLFREAARMEKENPSQTIEATMFETFFDRRLERYDTDYALINSERDEQEALIVKLTEANASFSAARRGDTSSKERERALNTLEDGYFAYKEIVQNLDVGRKFYNDLAGVVTKFRDDCRAFTQQRRHEAAGLEQEIVHALPMANLQIHGGGHQQHQPLPQQVQPHHQQPQAPQAQRQPQRETRSSAANTENRRLETAAPVHASPVQKVWTPDMPIKFAGPAAPTQPQISSKASGQAQARGGVWDPTKNIKFG